MRLEHLSTFKPLCPVCRNPGETMHRLALHEAYERAGDAVLHGMLRCGNPRCQCEFPILDGVPIIVAQVRDFVSANLWQIHARHDLPLALDTLIGDCCGPGSALDTGRQLISTYALDHYADLDPECERESAGQGSIADLLERGLEAVGEVQGPGLDVGCGAGRATFDLARRTGGPVLGVDMNFGLLRLAQSLALNGEASYLRRHSGLVYRTELIRGPFSHCEKVDFWICDATALPIGDGCLGTVCAFNVLDAVASPLHLLEEIARCLGPRGAALLTTPYDWSPAATPVEAWLGGHSQRGPLQGASEAVLARLVDNPPDASPLNDVYIASQTDRLPWTVTLHGRARVHYDVQLTALRKAARRG